MSRNSVIQRRLDEFERLLRKRLELMPPEGYSDAEEKRIRRQLMARLRKDAPTRERERQARRG